MNTWKVWAITVPILLLMIAFAVLLWLWNNVSSNWNPETESAQYVLNHTPIRHLQSYRVFTASGIEDVFRGTDVFDHEWYAFYVPSKHTAYSVKEAALLKPQIIESNLKSQHISVNSLSVGYVTDAASETLKPANNVVYEVRGSDGSSTTYVYVDATTGKVLWKYVL